MAMLRHGKRMRAAGQSLRLIFIPSAYIYVRTDGILLSGAAQGFEAGAGNQMCHLQRGRASWELMDMDMDMEIGAVYKVIRATNDRSCLRTGSCNYPKFPR